MLRFIGDASATGADVPVFCIAYLPGAPLMSLFGADIGNRILVSAQLADTCFGTVRCAGGIIIRYVFVINVGAVVSAYGAVAGSVAGVVIEIEFLAARAYVPVL